MNFDEFIVTRSRSEVVANVTGSLARNKQSFQAFLEWIAAKMDAPNGYRMSFTNLPESLCHLDLYRVTVAAV